MKPDVKPQVVLWSEPRLFNTQHVLEQRRLVTSESVLLSLEGERTTPEGSKQQPVIFVHIKMPLILQCALRDDEGINYM